MKTCMKKKRMNNTKKFIVDILDTSSGDIVGSIKVTKRDYDMMKEFVEKATLDTCMLGAWRK